MNSDETIHIDSPENRATLLKKTFSNTTYHDWYFAGVEFCECEFDNILSNNRSPSFFWCPVFNGTTFRNKIAKLKLNAEWTPPATDADKRKNRLWLLDMVSRYAAVDWALDISGATFTTSIDLNCVPGEKVRVNDYDQVVVPLKILRESYDAIEWGGSAWKIGCEWALNTSPFESMVVMATGKGKGRNQDMAVVSQLRKLLRV